MMYSLHINTYFDVDKSMVCAVRVLFMKEILPSWVHEDT